MNPTTEETAFLPESRPWSVRFLTFLFFVQAAGLLLIGIIDYEPLPALAALRLDNLPFSTLAFAGLTSLAILAGAGFVGLWATAWSNGMLLQGLTLLLALVFYFGATPFYTYLLMAYAIFMTLYLYHPDVQATFQTQHGD